MRNSVVRTTVTLAAAAMLLAGCSFGKSDKKDDASGSDTTSTATGNDNPNGVKIKIAFSAPGADHGWLAALTAAAKKEAAKYKDVEFIYTEGTNDSTSQVAQVESLIARKPNVLVILPNEGGALTPVALKAMAAGIQVVNVDREFTTASAYRLLLAGDNYGLGLSAGKYIARNLNCKGNVVEIQGIAGISVTDQRSAGFRDGIKRCGTSLKIVASQPADFVPDKGEKVMTNILQSQKKIDAVYTHDDDMAQGVVAAIKNAGRDKEMFVTGAGGSKWAMDEIAKGGLVRATFLYNPNMAASAIRLGRLIGLGAGLDELIEKEVPTKIVLPASKVDKGTLAKYEDLGY